MSAATWRSVKFCDLCGSTEFRPYLNRAVDGQSLVRCGDCGLVLLSPRPDAADIAAWYQEDYFNGEGELGMGPDYLSQSDAGILHGTEAFFEFAKRVRLDGLKVLEIGCGGGAFLVQCRNAGAEVFGLEISEFAADRLRQRHGLDVRIGFVEEAPFEPELFDLVVFTDVIEHVYRPGTFLKGIRRLLTVEGRMFGLMPNIDCVRHYGIEWGGFRHHAEHLYYFGSDQVRQYLDQAGLIPIEIWTSGEPWEPPTGSTVRCAKKPRPWRLALRKTPGLLPVVRTLRRWRTRLNSEMRERESRYRQGLGHNLYVLAKK